MPGSMIVAIPAVFAPLGTVGSWKSEKGRALGEVEDRIITTAMYIERRKPLFLNFCFWNSVPVPCPDQRWVRTAAFNFISDLPLGEYLHCKGYHSVLKAVNEVDSEMCSGSWWQHERFNFF